MNDTANTMKLSHEKAQAGAAHAEKAGNAFDQVSGSMETISQGSYQIAAAAEQQSIAAEGISKNIVSIRDIADSSMTSVEQTNKQTNKQTNQATNNLSKLAADLSQIVNKAT